MQWLYLKDNIKSFAMAMKVTLFKDNLWHKVIKVVSMTKPPCESVQNHGRRQTTNEKDL